MKRFFMLTVAVCAVIQVTSQNATIKGKVTDETTNAGVPFLSIAVVGTPYGTVTDMDGNYELSVAPGSYTLQFSSMEYETGTEKVTVAAGESRILNKTLKSQVVEMDIFVKSESKYEKRIEDVTVTLEVLKPTIVQNKNATSVDQSLQQVPGVMIVDSEPQIRSGSGYSFGAGSRVMVLVDDVPLLSGDAGRPSWGFIPIENLEQIEIIKGASSVLYGSAALNGVINVRTAFPKEKPLTKFTSFFGVSDLPDTNNWADDFPPFGAGFSFLHSRKIKQFDLVVGGNFMGSKGYVGPTADPAGAPSDTIMHGEHDYRARVNFNTRYRFKSKPGLAIGLNGNFLYSASSGAFLWQNHRKGIFRAFNGAITKTLMTVMNIDPYVTYSGAKGSTYNLRFRYFYLDNNNDNNQANASNLWFGELQYQKRFMEENLKEKKFLKHFSITTGLMSNYTIGVAELFEGTMPDPAAHNADSVTVDRINTDNLNVAAYIQLENKFFSRLTISVGARLEYFRIGKYDRYMLWRNGVSERFDTSMVDQGFQPVFRGGLNFRATEHTYIRASVGQGYRFPTIAERFISTTVGGVPIVPNPDLRPELSWSAEIGIKQGFKIGKFMGYADLAGYLQYYEDYIEFNLVFVPGGNPPFGFMSLNTGRSRLAGVDFSIMGTGNFTKDFGMSILAGYNWSLPQSLNPTLDYRPDTTVGITLSYLTTSSDTANNILKYRFQHTVKLDVEFNYKMFSFGVSFRYNSFMQNIDAAFKDLETAGLLKNGITDFREEHNNGDFVIDLRLACQISKTSKVSVIVNNLANRIYSLRPGKVEAPRSFVFQYAYQF